VSRVIMSARVREGSPHVAVDLVDRLAILVALRRFQSMGTSFFPSLRSH
jgi:hypothetical protein